MIFYLLKKFRTLFDHQPNLTSPHFFNISSILGLISQDKELLFFSVLSSLLQYNRLKLQYERSVYEQKSLSKNIGGLNHDFSVEATVPQRDQREEKGWIPSIKNVINAFDTMSFRRVFQSMERLSSSQIKRYEDIISPLSLYKEMICYLRVLLESSDETHNEFAIARLYSIFYTTSEKKDPLGRLLSEWTPGKEHSSSNILEKI